MNHAQAQGQDAVEAHGDQDVDIVLLVTTKGRPSNRMAATMRVIRFVRTYWGVPRGGQLA